MPLVVPTVNLAHLDLVAHQRAVHGLARGFLVCNSNCAVVGLVIPLAALQDAFGPVAAASVVTLQAVSGAGYPGVASMDVVDNVVPYIAGEEDKLESEARKILGRLNAAGRAVAEQDALRVSATCNRVPVLDGHLACVSLRFERRPAPSPAQCRAALRAYAANAHALGCPSAPSPPIVVFDDHDRPQPRLDRDLGNGYAVSVGRVREDESAIFDIKFTALSHNSEFCLLPASPRPRAPPLTAPRPVSRHRRRRILHPQRRSRHPQGLHLASPSFLSCHESRALPKEPPPSTARRAARSCFNPWRKPTFHSPRDRCIAIPLLTRVHGCATVVCHLPFKPSPFAGMQARTRKQKFRPFPDAYAPCHAT